MDEGCSGSLHGVGYCIAARYEFSGSNNWQIQGEATLMGALPHRR